MVIDKFVDDLIFSVQGAARTTNSKFQPKNIKDNLWQYRAIQLADAYKKMSRIVPQWAQNYQPDYDINLQDEKNIIKYAIPPVIQLDEFVLGFMYVGSPDCLNQYRLFRSRAEYATYRQHRVQQESNIPVAIYSDGIMEIHNCKREKISLRIDGVWQKPTDIPTFNEQLTDIPCDDANLQKIKLLMIQSIFGKEAESPVKEKNDFSDESAIPTKK